jgi:hypothetical protein
MIYLQSDKYLSTTLYLYSLDNKSLYKKIVYLFDKKLLSLKNLIMK